MQIIFSLGSVIVITLIVKILAHFGLIRICPICAGVSLTWLWILVGFLGGFLNPADWLLPAAIFMGGSVVGGAYLLEKVLFSSYNFLWRSLFIIVGFLVAYLALTVRLLPAGLIILVFGSITLLFRDKKNGNNPQKSSTTEELEKNLKNCC